MNHKVHCQWGDWIFGECSQSCGGGSRTRTRTQKVLAQNGGEECTGPASMDESCNVQNCQGIKIHLNQNTIPLNPPVKLS